MPGLSPLDLWLQRLNFWVDSNEVWIHYACQTVVPWLDSFIAGVQSLKSAVDGLATLLTKQIKGNCENIFLTGQWCRQFFRAMHAMHFFYSHSCCMIFLTVKALLRWPQGSVHKKGQLHIKHCTFLFAARFFICSNFFLFAAFF